MSEMIVYQPASMPSLTIQEQAMITSAMSIYRDSLRQHLHDLRAKGAEAVTDADIDSMRRRIRAAENLHVKLCTTWFSPVVGE